MTTIQLHRGSTARYLANDPVLADGEPALEYQTDPLLPPRVKYGNGVSHWSELPYADDGSTGGLVTSVAGRIGDIILTTADIGGLGSAATHPATDFDAAGAAAARVAKAGDTMTGPLVLPGEPTTALHAATKAYVDAHAAGFTVHSSCVAATTAALPACTYANGAGGVGATLTGNANGALTAQDGITLTAGQRLLVKDQAASLQDGAYTVTQVGDATHPFILTRATDADDSAELGGGSFFLVTSGSTIGGSSWVQTVTAPTIGTTALVFGQVAGPTTLTAGTAITVAGSTISVATGGVTDVQVAAGNKDGLAATPSLRTLGTGAQQAAAGNDPRLADARTPTVHHTTHELGGSDQLAIDASQIVAGLLSDSIIPSGIARDSEVSSAVTAAVSALVNSAPGLLDTLGEIAAALGNDPNVITNLTTLVGTKVAKSLYDANTILVANSDDTPGPLTIAEQTILGRITGGNIAALTPAQVRTLAGLVIGTDVQAFNANLSAIAALDSSTAGAIASDGAGWIKKTYAQFKTALGLTKSDVGLGNVDNTSDANKPVSTAQAAADVLRILDPGGPNDDFVQRKAGAWTNRTPGQVATDLEPTLDTRYVQQSTIDTPLLKLAATKKLTFTTGFATPGAGFEALLYRTPWTITSTATGGTFTLTWNGHTTTALNWNDSAATIFAAVGALTGWQGGGQSGGGPLNTAPVTFTESATATFHTITIQTGSLTGGTATLTAPGSGIIENIHIAIQAATMNQDSVLRIRTDGNTTPDIDIDLGTLFLSHNDAQSSAVLPDLQRATGASPTTPVPVPVIAATQHMQIALAQYAAGTGPANFANYQIRFPMPFTTGIAISLYNVNNTDAGLGAVDILYSTAATAPYRLMSAGSTWKNGGTQAAPTPVLTMPGTSRTLANVSGLSRGGIPVWVSLCEKAVAADFVLGTATGGTFTLTWNGHVTAPIAFNASAATVLTALQALTGWVSGGTTTGTAVNTTGIAIQQNTATPLAITIQTGSLTGGTATLTNSAGSLLLPYTYLERGISITPDGDATAAFQTGATEDFFQNAWYFQDASVVSTPTTAVTCANNIHGTMDAGLDLLEMCGGLPCNSSFVWTLGTSPANQTAHQMSYCVLYYKGV